MKAFFTLLLGLALPVTAAELKIVTVDLQRLLAEYDRAKEVGRQLEEKKTSFQKELDGLRLEGRKLMQETDALDKLSRDNALSAIERDAKRKAAEDKLADLRTFEVRYDRAQAQRQSELQTLASQSNKRIVDDVLVATRSVGDKEGVNLILNASRANPFGSDVVYAKGVDDITDKVLASLNRKP